MQEFCNSLDTFRLEDHYLPSANVARGNDCFPRTTEHARQVEALVASRLHIVRELYHYDISHRAKVCNSLGRD